VNFLNARKIFGLTLVLAILSMSSMRLLTLLPSTAASPSSVSLQACTTGVLTGTTLVSAAPPGAKTLDDLTLAVKGLDDGKHLLWTEWQNGINPDGTPSSTGAPQSLVAGYDVTTDALVRQVVVNGHVDGLIADLETGTLATSNEAANSFLALIYPTLGAVATYTYGPSPEVSGNG
jgi:hypothetical protein